MLCTPTLASCTCTCMLQEYTSHQPELDPLDDDFENALSTSLSHTSSSSSSYFSFSVHWGSPLLSCSSHFLHAVQQHILYYYGFSLPAVHGAISATQHKRGRCRSVTPSLSCPQFSHPSTLPPLPHHSLSPPSSLLLVTDTLSLLSPLPVISAHRYPSSSSFSLHLCREVHWYHCRLNVFWKIPREVPQPMQYCDLYRVSANSRHVYFQMPRSEDNENNWLAHMLQTEMEFKSAVIYNI